MSLKSVLNGAFLCGVVHSGRGLISVFQGFSASVGGAFSFFGGAGRWDIVLCGLGTFLGS